MASVVHIKKHNDKTTGCENHSAESADCSLVWQTNGGTGSQSDTGLVANQIRAL